MQPKQTRSERWRQIEQLYHAALSCATSERAAFLTQACAGDEALRREVESLLSFDRRAAHFIEAPALEVAAQAHAEAQTAALTGQMIGHYRILSWLGAGGMSEVYLAFDTRLERQVALKLLPPQFTRDAERMCRFIQEAKAASALNHPNIITIHDIGESEGVYFIATEYVEGRTLRDLLPGAPLELGRALDVTTQVANALAVAHAAGIVHRDIKPENVMVRPDGYLKVLDFGIAKLVEKDEGGRMKDETAAEPSLHPSSFILHPLTEPGLVLGTAQYMSPEQARGLEVDERTDIFSLGVMLYEMVAGHRPFEGVTRAEIIRAVTEDEPPLLADEVPVALRQLISRALEKDRDARYQSANELLAELQQFKRELGTSGQLKLAYQPAAWREAALTTSGARLDTATQAAGLRTVAENNSILRRSGQRALKHRAVILLMLIALAVAGVLTYFFARAPQTEIDSLAVLPFVNAGADANAEYLADGLTDGLINSLSQLPRIKVKARSSVFRFKKQQSDPLAIARQLGVSAVLTGQITQRGEALSISAELVDARDGSHLWGAQYERRLVDLMLVQEEITQRITTGLRLKLTAAETKQLGKRYTENTEAYQLYLKGRYFFMQFTPEGIAKALDHFQQAITRDPNYALAYAGTGYVYAVAASQYQEPRETMQRARQASLRALELDEALPEAHFALALVKWWADWDWSTAETEFKRTLELNPNNGTMRAVYSDFLSTQERFAEALAQAQRAQELEPLSVYVNGVLAKVYYHARQYDRALAIYRQALELDPASTRAQRGLGRVLLQQGQHAEAIAILRQAVARETHPYFISDLGRAYAVAGRRTEARQMLAQLQALAQRRYVSPVYIAKVYAGLGETSAALALLNRALQEHSDQLTELRVDPAFDPLRSEPRFADLLRRVGL